MKSALINLLLFKAGWTACVLLAAGGLPHWAALSVAFIVAVHLARASVPVKEALFLVLAGLAGLAWETVVLHSGLLSYPTASDPGGWAPYWIVALWVLFATTIGHGFSWIKRSWMVAAGVGLIGGPLAFLAGAKIGAVNLLETWPALLLIGAGWSVLLPLLALLSDTLIDSAFLEPRTTVRRAPRSPRHVTRGSQNA